MRSGGVAVEESVVVDDAVENFNVFCGVVVKAVEVVTVSAARRVAAAIFMIVMFLYYSILVVILLCVLMRIVVCLLDALLCSRIAWFFG